jgi:hypothetical protein
MNGTSLAQWVIGALIVVIYALNRFETPSPVRATTTFMRYSIARFCYVFAMLTLFILLGGGLTESAGILGMVVEGVKVPNDAASLPGPLYAALLLTALLPHVPLLSNIDAWVKQEFQRIGNIPFEVRQLSARLQQAPFRPDVNLYPGFRDDLKDLGIDEVWFAGPRDSLEGRWSRIAALNLIVGRWWPGLRGYARYSVEQKQLLADIDDRVNALHLALNESGVIGATGKDPSRALTATLSRQLNREMLGLGKSLCDIVSGGVLQCEWARGDRKIRLEEMGFSGVEELRHPLSVHEVLFVGAIVFVVMNAVALVTRHHVPSSTLTHGLYTAAMVSIIYGAAIVIALYPKTVWQFADIQHAQSRPYGAYVVSGVLAALLAFVIAVMFKYVFVPLHEFLAEGHLVRVLADTVEKWPWLLMTLGATISIAWAADDYATQPGEEPRWLRWAEAAGLAAVFCALQWYVSGLLIDNGVDHIREKQLQFLLTAAVVGACIGFLVPHLYRKANAALRTAHNAPQAIPGIGPAR